MASFLLLYSVLLSNLKLTIPLCCDCNVPTPTRSGCPADRYCELPVCEDDPFCCGENDPLETAPGQWDETCAARADTICSLPDLSNSCTPVNVGYNIRDNNWVGQVIVRNIMEISFDLRIDDGCASTQICHIFAIGDRYPLIYTNQDGKLLFYLSPYDEIEVLTNAYSLIVDGNWHHLYFKHTKREVFITIDGAIHVDKIVDHNSLVLRDDSLAVSTVWVDRGNQFAHHGVIKNICINSMHQSSDPTAALSSAPTPDSGHIIVYGNPSKTFATSPECTSDYSTQAIAENLYNDTDIAVTCCNFTTGIIGSALDCEKAFNYFGAETYCNTNGMVLCSLQQIYDGAGQKRECDFGKYYVWTRTTCTNLGKITTSMPTKYPTVNPSEVPSSNPTKSPTSMPTQNAGHIIIFGHPLNTKHEVPPPECTSDYVTQSIAKNKRNKTAIGVICCYSELGTNGSRPDCKEKINYFEAKSHCQSNGMILCSRQQIYDGAGQGGGCGFDGYQVWTRTACTNLGKIPTSSPTKSPTNPSIASSNSPSSTLTNSSVILVSTTTGGEGQIAETTDGILLMEEEELNDANDLFLPIIISFAAFICLCIICLTVFICRLARRDKRRLEQSIELGSASNQYSVNKAKHQSKKHSNIADESIEDEDDTQESNVVNNETITPFNDTNLDVKIRDDGPLYIQQSSMFSEGPKNAPNIDTAFSEGPDQLSIVNEDEFIVKSDDEGSEPSIVDVKTSLF